MTSTAEYVMDDNIRVTKLRLNEFINVGERELLDMEAQHVAELKELDEREHSVHHFDEEKPSDDMTHEKEVLSITQTRLQEIHMRMEALAKASTGGVLSADDMAMFQAEIRTSGPSLPLIQNIRRKRMAPAETRAEKKQRLEKEEADAYFNGPRFAAELAKCQKETAAEEKARKESASSFWRTN